MADYHVIETTEALDQYKQAPPELLILLSRVVYPALRADPTNDTGLHPIRYQRGGWYTFEVETPGGGLQYLLDQVIEELSRVMVFALVSFHEP